VYEPGTGPAPPPPKAPKPTLPERDVQDYGAAAVADTGVDTPQYRDPPSVSAVNARPMLPPRLPPRQLDGFSRRGDVARAGMASPEESKGYLNQDAVNRLGHAGIAVHGLGIGTQPPPPVPSRAAAPPVPSRASAPPVPERKFGGQQMHGLQSRFSTLSSAPSEAPPGTTLEQKKAALKTAQALKSDPSSVSAADVRTAAATAKNFHDRHGEQVASGVRTANQLNQKYGLVDRARAMVPADGSALSVRPPPPPTLRPNNVNVSGGSGPPHVPYATKPRS
jgi:hypothetical protein